MGVTKKISITNMKKTIRYFKKNGFLNTTYAIVERMTKSQLDEYTPKLPTEEELEEQRTYAWKNPVKISIIVPAYETKEMYLQQMIESVLAQTYYDWELVIADASSSNLVEDVVKSYDDVRIVYERLKDNKGISENTNEALRLATGDYVALLDHDDIITPDTLYEVVHKLDQEAVLDNDRDSDELTEAESGRSEADRPIFIYTDEDKVNETLTHYYEPNYKQEFNLDLILSNNYICHFSVIRADYIKSMGFRPEYDGAQDYDLFLRIVARLWKEKKLLKIEHIDKVLYHWRCHHGSTSENPESKMYAYEAGRRALQDFVKGQCWNAVVTHTEHLGFYRINYDNDNILAQREDVGVVGGKVIRGKKIHSGAMFLDGTALYKGLSMHYSGYMHRGAMQQDTDAVDIRCMKVSKSEEMNDIWLYYNECYDRVANATEEEIIKMSLEICRRVREAGKRVVYDPVMCVTL
ncbi:MAG: glycosyltransferase [Lachnospiraceae bacterium]|nr:glycosyltransferase [Lachnospiraceae bacterium]